MTEFSSRLARDRLQQLALTLTTLRERIRDAVASEMGKAVGEALRDLITAVLSKTALTRRAVEPTPSPPPHREEPSRWDDDEDDDWPHERANTAGDHRSLPPAPSASPASPAAAWGLGLGLTRWLLMRQAPLWAGLAAGLLAGLASLSQHPIVQAGIGVVAAATQLLPLTEFTANSPD